MPHYRTATILISLLSLVVALVAIKQQREPRYRGLLKTMRQQTMNMLNQHAPQPDGLELMRAMKRYSLL